MLFRKKVLSLYLKRLNSCNQYATHGHSIFNNMQNGNNMKTFSNLINIIVFLLISCTNPNNTIAQVVWTPIGAKWYYSLPDENLGNPFYNVRIYEHVKDTIIDSKQCDFIVSDIDTIITCYQDSIVYWYINNDFFELFNYKAQIHDTISLTRKLKIQELNDSIIIMELSCIIDTIRIINSNGLLLKEYQIHYLHNNYLTDSIPFESGDIYIEKAGSTIDNFINIVDVGFYPLITPDKLRCYFDTSIHYIAYWFENYYYNYHYNCDYTLHINELINLPDILYYYSEPDILTVILKKDETFYLVDQMGRIYNIFNFKAGQNEIALNMFPKGIYLLISNFQKSNIKILVK